MAWSDLTDLMNDAVRDTFAQTVSYTPVSTGVAVDIEAEFDAAFVSLQVGAEVPVTSVGPALSVVLADLDFTPTADDDTCTVGGVIYRVVDVQPDGSGMAMLPLRKIGVEP